jgi:ABC-2 type transport system permease protein/sodium transport system permease protein
MAPHTEHRTIQPNERLRRLGRLTLKELREILRDRRTIVTLILMPLLMYPLLSVFFQQFFMSQLGTVQTPRYALGFENDQEGSFLANVLSQGGLSLVQIDAEVPAQEGESRTTPIVEAGIRSDLVEGLEEFEIDVGLRLKGEAPSQIDDQRDLALDIDLLFRDDSLKSRDAAAYIEKYLRAANETFLAARLEKLGVTQRAAPIRWARTTVEQAGTHTGTISIAAVIPFVLILMTVTGAVYPAIDLTAGERERGTLEILMAAPIPRVGVLFAKYVAVLSVALLTAAANLLTMTITISASGMGSLLFGEAGISPGVIAAVFGLLLLFAAFFSAVLLVITSSARSFKEAQAYLIPLMLVALAPGMLSLMPGLELSGLLLVTPLANIVLLGRDLFAFKASGGAALTVVASTLLYAAAAIGLAARIFGAESVLYSSQPGWADLVRRPRASRTAPTLTAAAFCLALMFPLYFLMINLLGGAAGIGEQLLAGVVITAVVFGVVPLIACWMRRASIAACFRWPESSLPIFIGAILVGLSLWMLDHETVMLSKTLRGVELDAGYLDKLQQYVGQLRQVPLVAILLAMAIVPAVFEEAFFRGYLFTALRSAGNAWTAIVVSALTFGLFHAIVPNPLASERLVSSALTGLVLGWVRWRTGSILPGTVLHVCHNGLLMLLTYYEPQLAARGIGVTDSTHLPGPWLAGGAVALVGGVVMIFAFSRPRAP